MGKTELIVVLLGLLGFAWIVNAIWSRFKPGVSAAKSIGSDDAPPSGATEFAVEMLARCGDVVGPAFVLSQLTGGQTLATASKNARAEVERLLAEKGAS